MTRRWKLRAREEMGQVQDLVRVLFKPRNGEAWTRDDRTFLKRELAMLAGRWAPGFFLFLLPGGLLVSSVRGGTPGATPTEAGLPRLPEGFRYTDVVKWGPSLVLPWEEVAFTDVGRAGILVYPLAGR